MEKINLHDRTEEEQAEYASYWYDLHREEQQIEEDNE